MASRQRIWVDRAGARMALARWGDTDSSKPPALPVHGAGFVAEVRDEVAQERRRQPDPGHDSLTLTEIRGKPKPVHHVSCE